MKSSSSKSIPDTQTHSNELHISTPPRQSIESMSKKKRRNKCHGNRCRRNFKRKCRRRGMSDEAIQKLIVEYDRQRKPTIQTNEVEDVTHHRENIRTTTTTEDMEITTTTTTTTVGFNDMNNQSTTTTRKSKKRKHITPSSSQQQRSTKKTKKRSLSSSQIMMTTPIQGNYRLPNYLKVSTNVIFQSLRLQSLYTLKKKNEQQFIYHRLPLIDQQCRLNLNQNLWQSYSNLGSVHHLWPDHVSKRAKTKEHELCRQFVDNYLKEIQLQLDQCKTELLTQSQSCPITLLPLSTLDYHLKNFIQLQQQYLSKKYEYQLIRYQKNLHENELFQTVSMYTLTIEQKNTMDYLKNLRQQQLDCFEQFLKLQTRVSIQFLPKNFNKLEQIMVPNFYLPSIRDTIAVEFKQKQYKIIQEAKRSWLNMYVNAYELKYQEYEYQYQEEFKKFELNRSIHVRMKDGTTLFDSFQTYIHYRTNRIQQDIYYEKIPFYRRQLIRFHRNSLKESSTQQRVAVFPRIILDIFYHPFTTKELAYLSRGPTYIRPNQSALRPKEQRIKQIDKEVNDIMKKLTKYMANSKDPPPIPPTAPFYDLYANRLRTYLTDRYMTPLPLLDQLRARRELKLVKSIRQKLKHYKLVLRQTDKSGVLHIGRAIDYERKAIEYREKTKAYELLPLNPFDDVFNNVTRLLNQLKTLKKLYEWQRLKMAPIRTKTELAYMYFLPKPHKIGTPPRPIINTIHAATTKISKFLDRLIRPLFDRYAKATTIIDGTDLLTKLSKYIQQGYFTSLTLFITFDISNLYTMLPQDDSLSYLEEFLRQYAGERINGISIDTIVQLARIVLEMNVFVYNNKFYRQIIGGAMGSAFTLTLANIFMWKWQQQTILKELPFHEIFGRYIDDVFVTWNGSEEAIKKILEKANEFHPNIKLEYQIGKSLPFLDVLITNNNGILVSSLYHKPSAEPVVVSYLSDHPRHVFRNVIQTALMRAIRYSSTFEAFNYEQRNIRLMLLYNQYPIIYIDEEVRRFFTQYLSLSTTSLLPLIDNENQFFLLRQKLFAQPTAKQTQVAYSAASVNVIPYVQQTTSTKIETSIKKNDEKFKKNLFIHCKFEGQLAGLAKEIHTIHDSYFKNTPHGHIRLVVGHQNNPNIEFELARKRPSSSLLKDPRKQNPPLTAAAAAL